MRMSDTVALLSYLRDGRGLHDCCPGKRVIPLQSVAYSYHVAQCTRCTSSVSASNRVTNGHRFVFHSSEVSGTERHYVRGEPGVIPFGPCIFVPPPPSASPTPQHVPYPSPPFSPYPHYNQRPSRSRSSSPPVFRSDYLPTPPLEFAVPEYASSRYNSPEPDAPVSSA